MGFTHYYYRLNKLVHDKPTWAKFLADVKKVIAELPAVSHSSGGYFHDVPLKLAGGNGEGEPEFSEKQIIFNGVKKDDLWHETMYIPRIVRLPKNSKHNYTKYQREQFEKEKKHFMFCKTARKPYDLAVQAVLILYKYHFNEQVAVSSDGDEADWQEAIELVAKVNKIAMSFDQITTEGSVTVRTLEPTEPFGADTFV